MPLMSDSFAVATVLAGGAGIRAVAPLFVVSLMHHLSPNEVPLFTDEEWLGDVWVMWFLGILFAVEVAADCIPGVDNVLHVFMAWVHPIAGAIAAMAPTYPGGLAGHLGMAAFGAGTSTAIHSYKATLRLGSTTTTFGCLNPLLSCCGTIMLLPVLFECVHWYHFAVFVAIITLICALIGTYFGIKRYMSGESDADEDDTVKARESSGAPIGWVVVAQPQWSFRATRVDPCNIEPLLDSA